MVTVGLYVRLTAKAGKEAELASFLAGAGAIAQDEPRTAAWFAVRFDERTFAVFDVFADEGGRQAHLTGRIAAALMAKAGELLAEPPNIERHDVLAAKL